MTLFCAMPATAGANPYVGLTTSTDKTDDQLKDEKNVEEYDTMYHNPRFGVFPDDSKHDGVRVSRPRIVTRSPIFVVSRVQYFEANQAFRCSISSRSQGTIQPRTLKLGA